MSTNGGKSHDVVEAARHDAPVIGEKAPITGRDDITNPKDDSGAVASGSDTDEPLRGPNGEEYPSKRDLETLRRVKGHISPIIYTIAFIELCERFAYYGTTAVCMLHLRQSALKFEHVLSANSCQFHSAASPGRVYYGRGWNVWTAGCTRSGPTSFHWSRHFQQLLGLFDAFTR